VAWATGFSREREIIYHICLHASTPFYFAQKACLALYLIDFLCCHGKMLLIGKAQIFNNSKFQRSHLMNFEHLIFEQNPLLFIQNVIGCPIHQTLFQHGELGFIDIPLSQ